mmetsp:Transcript_21409/g.56434  ORF Transcript_21409/g.56434 Transcript_21409/m.56434 type:complete len:537 (-) Transcript_21409:7-1617(-)
MTGWIRPGSSHPSEQTAVQSVRRAAEAPLERLVEHLAQRRVRVHHHRQVLERRARLDRVGALLNEVGRVQADDVHSDHLVRILAEDDLRDAIARELGEGLRVGTEGALRDSNLVAARLRPLARLLLRRADHRDLGVREARSRNGVVIEHVLIAAHVLDGRDALRRRRVREHHLAVEIADTPEAFDHVAVRVEGTHLLVGRDETAVDLHVDVLEAQALRKGRAARAHHHGVHLNRLGVLLSVGVDHLDRDRLDARDAGDDLGGEDAGVVVDRARPDQHALRLLRDLLVEGRHDARHRLDEGDLGAERRVHVGELEADVARADDGDPVGHPLEVERLVRREHRLAVDLDAGRHERHGPRREDDIVGGDGLAAADQLDLGRADHLALVGEDRDAEAGERVLEVALHLVRQVLRVRSDLLALVRHAVARDPKAVEVVLVRHLAHAARGGEERLRRNAAAIHARPADVLARAHRDLQPARHRVERGAVAAHAAANDDEVKVLVGHEDLRLSCGARRAQRRRPAQLPGGRRAEESQKADGHG